MQEYAPVLPTAVAWVLHTGGGREERPSEHATRVSGFEKVSFHAICRDFKKMNKPPVTVLEEVYHFFSSFVSRSLHSSTQEM